MWAMANKLYSPPPPLVSAEQIMPMYFSSSHLANVFQLSSARKIVAEREKEHSAISHFANESSLCALEWFVIRIRELQIKSGCSYVVIESRMIQPFRSIQCICGSTGLTYKSPNLFPNWDNVFSRYISAVRHCPQALREMPASRHPQVTTPPQLVTAAHSLAVAVGAATALLKSGPV